MNDTHNQFHGESAHFGPSRNIDQTADLIGFNADSSVNIPMPANSPTDVANTGKKANWKSTSEAPCPDDNKPANADSFAHRK